MKFRKKQLPMFLREKRNRYAIRKYRVGTFSVLIGAFWLLGGLASVQAEEIKMTPITPVTVTDKIPVTTEEISAPTMLSDLAKIKEKLSQLDSLLSVHAEEGTTKENLLARATYQKIHEAVTQTKVFSQEEITQFNTELDRLIQAYEQQSIVTDESRAASSEEPSTSEETLSSLPSIELSELLHALQDAEIENAIDLEENRSVLKEAKNLVATAKEQKTLTKEEMESFQQKVDRMVLSVRNAITRTHSGKRDERNGDVMSQGEDFRAITMTPVGSQTIDVYNSDYVNVVTDIKGSRGKGDKRYMYQSGDNRGKEDTTPYYITNVKLTNPQQLLDGLTLIAAFTGGQKEGTSIDVNNPKTQGVLRGYLGSNTVVQPGSYKVAITASIVRPEKGIKQQRSLEYTFRVRPQSDRNIPNAISRLYVDDVRHLSKSEKDAIIANFKEANQQLYQRTQTVHGGGKVSQVDIDHLEFTANGEEIILHFKDGLSTRTIRSNVVNDAKARYERVYLLQGENSTDLSTPNNFVVSMTGRSIPSTARVEWVTPFDKGHVGDGQATVRITYQNGVVRTVAIPYHVYPALHVKGNGTFHVNAQAGNHIGGNTYDYFNSTLSDGFPKGMTWRWEYQTTVDGNMKRTSNGEFGQLANKNVPQEGTYTLIGTFPIGRTGVDDAQKLTTRASMTYRVYDYQAARVYSFTQGQSLGNLLSSPKSVTTRRGSSPEALEGWFHWSAAPRTDQVGKFTATITLQLPPDASGKQAPALNIPITYTVKPKALNMGANNDGSVWVDLPVKQAAVQSVIVKYQSTNGKQQSILMRQQEGQWTFDQNINGVQLVGNRLKLSDLAVEDRSLVQAHAEALYHLTGDTASVTAADGDKQGPVLRVSQNRVVLTRKENSDDVAFTVSATDSGVGLREKKPFELVGYLPDGLSFNPQTGRISGVTSLGAVTQSVQIRAFDKKGNSSTIPVTFVVQSQAEKYHPEGGSLTVVQDATVTQESLRKLITKLPNGSKIQSITYNPVVVSTKSIGQKVVRATIRYKDNSQGTVSLFVNVLDVTKPTITTMTEKKITKHEPFTDIPVMVRDNVGGSGVLSVNVHSLPEYLEYNPSTRVIHLRRGELVPDNATSSVVTITAQDIAGNQADAKTLRIIVQSQSDKYTPKSQSQSVKNGEIPSPENSIGNRSELPPTTQYTWKTTPDTTAKGEQQGTVTVTYPDGSHEDVSVTITVTPQSDSYDPTPVPQTVKNGEIPSPENSIGNRSELPQMTQYTWKTTPDTTAKGDQSGTVTVTYPDGSHEDVSVTITVTPQSDSYDPTPVTQTVKNGETPKAENSIGNRSELPPTTQYTWKTTPDTTAKGEQSGTVTVTYPDGSHEDVPVTITVTPQSDTYIPTPVTQTVKNGETPTAENSIGNRSELPPTTQYTWKTTPDTTAKGDQSGTVTVTYPDGSHEDVSVTITVTPQSDSYHPTPVPQTVKNGETPTAENSIGNRSELPPTTQYTWKTTPDTTAKGNQKGVVTVTYPDGSHEDIPVTITVTPQSDTYIPTPVTQTVKNGETPTAENSIGNRSELPPTTQYTWKTTPDTTAKGEQSGTVTVTYPDGSHEDIPVTITVTPQSDTYIPTPVPQTVKNGETPTAENSIGNRSELPPTTQYTWKTTPDTTAKGDQSGTVTVTYPDGSHEDVSVTITVTPQSDSYHPTPVPQTVKNGETPTAENSIGNRSELPPTTQYTWKTTPDTTAKGNQKGVVTVTYPDGSHEDIPVTITVTPQSDTYIPTPVSQTVKNGETPKAENSIGNRGELPPTTQYTWKTTPDTTAKGDQRGVVTVTYPDGSHEEITVTITVMPQSDSYHPTPVPQTVKNGETPTAENSIGNRSELPPTTQYTWKTTPDTTAKGEQQGVVTVTYPDGSHEDVSVTITVTPQSDTYIPTPVPQTVKNGETPTAENSIGNRSELPPTTQYTWKTTPDTTAKGDQRGVVTVTYPDGSHEEITVTITVMPQSDSYHPTPVPQTVKNGETPTAENSIGNRSELPSTTQYTWKTTPDTTAKGNQTGTVTVTYPDGSHEDVSVTITVTPQSDSYHPTPVTQTVKNGETPTAENSIGNRSELPPMTQYTWKTTPDTMAKGDQQGVVTVTYPDGSHEDIPVTITVTPQSDSYDPTPVPQTVKNGETPTAENSIGNRSELPPTTQYTWKTTPDTTAKGNQKGVVTVTYPDGSHEDIPVTITVTPQSDSYDPTPVTQTVKNGETPKAENSIGNRSELPPTTQYTWKTTPDTTAKGNQTGTVTVTYPDGSHEDVSVTITVTPQSDSYDPTPVTQTVKNGETPKAENSIGNRSELPPTTQYTWKTTPDTTAKGNQKGVVTVTYPDGSHEDVSVTITVTPQSDTYIPTPVPQTVKNGETPTAENSIGNRSELPPTTQYTWKTTPDTSTAGNTEGVITINYRDGSFENLQVMITVIEKHELGEVVTEESLSEFKGELPTVTQINQPQHTLITPDEVKKHVKVPAGGTIKTVGEIPEVETQGDKKGIPVTVELVTGEVVTIEVPVTIHVVTSLPNEAPKHAIEELPLDQVPTYHEHGEAVTQAELERYPEDQVPTYHEHGEAVTQAELERYPEDQVPTYHEHGEVLTQAEPERYPEDQVPTYHEHGEALTQAELERYPEDQVPPYHEHGEALTQAELERYPEDQVPTYHEHGEAETQAELERYPEDQVPTYHEHGEVLTQAELECYPEDHVPTYHESGEAETQAELERYPEDQVPTYHDHGETETQGELERYPEDQVPTYHEHGEVLTQAELERYPEDQVPTYHEHGEAETQAELERYPEDQVPTYHEQGEVLTQAELERYPEDQVPTYHESGEAETQAELERYPEDQVPTYHEQGEVLTQAELERYPEDQVPTYHESGEAETQAELERYPEDQVPTYHEQGEVLTQAELERYPEDQVPTYHEHGEVLTQAEPERYPEDQVPTYHEHGEAETQAELERYPEDQVPPYHEHGEAETQAELERYPEDQVPPYHEHGEAETQAELEIYPEDQVPTYHESGEAETQAELEIYPEDQVPTYHEHGEAETQAELEIYPEDQVPTYHEHGEAVTQAELERYPEDQVPTYHELGEAPIQDNLPEFQENLYSESNSQNRENAQVNDREENKKAALLPMTGTSLDRISPIWAALLSFLGFGVIVKRDKEKSE